MRSLSFLQDLRFYDSIIIGHVHFSWPRWLLVAPMGLPCLVFYNQHLLKKCWSVEKCVWLLPCLLTHKGMRRLYKYTLAQNIPGGMNKKIMLVAFEKGDWGLRSCGWVGIGYFSTEAVLYSCCIYSSLILCSSSHTGLRALSPIYEECPFALGFRAWNALPPDTRGFWTKSQLLYST